MAKDRRQLAWADHERRWGEERTWVEETLAGLGPADLEALKASVAEATADDRVRRFIERCDATRSSFLRCLMAEAVLRASARARAGRPGPAAGPPDGPTAALAA